MLCGFAAPVGSVPGLDFTGGVEVQLHTAAAQILCGLLPLIQQIIHIPDLGIAILGFQFLSAGIILLPFDGILLDFLQGLPVDLASGQIRSHGIQFHHIPVELRLLLLDPAQLLFRFLCFPDVFRPSGIESGLDLPLPACGGSTAGKTLPVLNGVLDLMYQGILQSHRIVLQLIAQIDAVELGVVGAIDTVFQSLEHNRNVGQVWIGCIQFFMLHQLSQGHVVDDVIGNFHLTVIDFIPPLAVHAFVPAGLLADGFIVYTLPFQFLGLLQCAAVSGGSTAAGEAVFYLAIAIGAGLHFLDHHTLSKQLCHLIDALLHL